MGATVLGLMSGTSADGVDAVLARFDGAPRRPRWLLIQPVFNLYGRVFPSLLRFIFCIVAYALTTPAQ